MHHTGYSASADCMEVVAQVVPLAFVAQEPSFAFELVKVESQDLQM